MDTYILFFDVVTLYVTCAEKCHSLDFALQFSVIQPCVLHLGLVLESICVAMLAIHLRRIVQALFNSLHEIMDLCR